MNKELQEYIDTHKIEKINPIKGIDNDFVGYHLQSSNMKNHHNDFHNIDFFLKNFKQPYYAVDGYNFTHNKHDIFLHKIH